MDFELVERLVRLVEEANIGELELETKEGFRLVVKKPSAVPLAPSLISPMLTGVAPQVPLAPIVPPGAKAEEETDPSLGIIKAPMVGTFYRAPAPDAPPFVETGDAVQNNTVICILEAMKVMNEIKAGMAGVVKEILAENGQPVEFGQPLFKIKKN